MTYIIKLLSIAGPLLKDRKEKNRHKYILFLTLKEIKTHLKVIFRTVTNSYGLAVRKWIISFL